MTTEDSRKNLERFMRLVLADPSLHEQLRRNTGLENFVALTVRLGAKHGCAFAPEDVFAALDERAGVLRERRF